jgi:hypothetical protein
VALTGSHAAIEALREMADPLRFARRAVSRRYGPVSAPLGLSFHPLSALLWSVV